MQKSKAEKTPMRKNTALVVVAAIVVIAAGVVAFIDPFAKTYDRADAESATGKVASAIASIVTPVPTLDIKDYDKRMLALAHRSLASTTATSTATSTPHLWPVATARAPYPLPGALLPFHRIVAYYGNFYSTGMGVLGQYPPEQMLAKLKDAVAEWNQADPSTPVIPAIHYIVVTAQGSAGADGKYRLRMPDSQIDKALSLAAEVNGIVFLDFQVGLSDVQDELPLYAKYFALPNVHVGIDPEFAMQTSGQKPGTVIGTMDATSINWAARYLAGIVDANHIPPKILVIHRFTEDMVTHYRNITPLPEVQVVMNMDGWGFPTKKINTYSSVVASEPVEFTGFKLFYKNDLKPPSTRLLTPAEVLSLTPAPIYIQYQ